MAAKTSLTELLVMHHCLVGVATPTPLSLMEMAISLHHLVVSTSRCPTAMVPARLPMWPVTLPRYNIHPSDESVKCMLAVQY